MGKFVLCVETTVRDVNELLGFHKVHPQVQQDVKRRLMRLVHSSYDYTETLEPGFMESAQDVCSAIVNEMVNNTIQNVIPIVEISAEEKRTASLVQRISELSDELAQSQKRCLELEAYISRFRTTHEIVLHTYFREVLVLRFQLQEATMQKQVTQQQSLPGGSFAPRRKNSSTSVRSLHLVRQRERRVGADGASEPASPSMDDLAATLPTFTRTTTPRATVTQWDMSTSQQMSAAAAEQDFVAERVSARPSLFVFESQISTNSRREEIGDASDMSTSFENKGLNGAEEFSNVDDGVDELHKVTTETDDLPLPSAELCRSGKKSTNVKTEASTDGTMRNNRAGVQPNSNKGDAEDKMKDNLDLACEGRTTVLSKEKNLTRDFGYISVDGNKNANASYECDRDGVSGRKGKEGKVAVRGERSAVMVKSKTERSEWKNRTGSRRKSKERRNAFTQTQITQTAGNDKVNAIFDYEEYIRMYHSDFARFREGLEGESGMFAGSSNDPGKSARDKRRKEELIGTRQMHRELLRGHMDALATLAAKSEEDATFDRATSLRMALVIKPIKGMLREQLDMIMKAVDELREQHENDMSALRDVIRRMILRLDSLVEFFALYVDEISRLTAVATQEMEHQVSTERRSSGVKRSGSILTNLPPAMFLPRSDDGDDPCTSRLIFDFFTPRSILSLISGSTISPEKSDVFSDDDEEEEEEEESEEESDGGVSGKNGLDLGARHNGRAHELQYWDTHPTIIHARRVFANLQVAILKLRDFTRGEGRQRILTAKGRRPSDRFAGLRRVSRRDGEETSSMADLEAQGSDDLLDLEGMTREELLRAIVQCRLRRIVCRTRRHQHLRNLADAAHSGLSSDLLLPFLDDVQGEEVNIGRLTRIINRIAELLGLGIDDSDVSDTQRALFVKNLALSPYLYDTGARAADGEDNIVFIPVPVKGDRAEGLCSTLASNQPGYVVFGDEVIPIANITYCQNTRRRFLSMASSADGRGTLASKTGTAGTVLGGRRRGPLYGAVTYFYRGVQLARPIGERQGPLYVPHDSDTQSAFLEGDDAARLAAPRRQSSPPPLPTRTVRLATTLLSGPPPPPPPPPPPAQAPSAPLAPQALCTVSARPALSAPVGSGTAPWSTGPQLHPVPEMAPRPGPGAPPPPVMYRSLRPFNAPPLPSGGDGIARTTRYGITPLQKEGQELMRIESIGANRAEQEQSQWSSELALTRLKGDRQRRDREDADRVQSENARRRDEWIRCGKVKEPTMNERFLRVRFPLVPTPTVTPHDKRKSKETEEAKPH